MSKVEQIKEKYSSISSRTIGSLEKNDKTATKTMPSSSINSFVGIMGSEKAHFYSYIQTLKSKKMSPKAVLRKICVVFLMLIQVDSRPATLSLSITDPPIYITSQICTMGLLLNRLHHSSTEV